MILFYHDTNEDGQVALANEIIAGQWTPDRYYRQKGHFLEVDPPANAVEHDTAELGKLGYRLATAREQQDFVKQQKRAGSLEE